MSAHEEGILRETAEATRMARLHGCTIEVSIKRFGHRVDVVIRPDGVPDPDADRTAVLPALPEQGQLKEDDR